MKRMPPSPEVELRIPLLEADEHRADEAERDAGHRQHVRRQLRLRNALHRALQDLPGGLRVLLLDPVELADARALRGRLAHVGCGSRQRRNTATAEESDAGDDRDRDAGDDVEPVVVAGPDDREPDPDRPQEPEHADQSVRQTPNMTMPTMNASIECRDGIAAYGLAVCAISPLAWLTPEYCARVSTKPQAGNIRGGAVGTRT